MRPKFEVNVASLASLTRDLRKIGNTDIPKRIRQGLQEAAEIVASDARGRASFSTRIPGSIRTGVTTRGAYVQAGGPSAPHAVTFEGRKDGGNRRHPVFARGPRSSWTWVEQPARPFLRTALEANKEQVRDKVMERVEDAFRDNNFK